MVSKKNIQNILFNNKLHLINGVLINELLKNGSLDNFLYQLSKVNKYSVVCENIYKKKKLTQVELFLINLDFFINHIEKTFNLSNLYNFVIVNESLKSKYSKILLCTIYYSENFETLKYYKEEFDKMVVDSFLPTLKFMSKYVVEELNNFNIDIANISETNSKDRIIVIQLLTSLIIANNKNLINIVPRLFLDLDKYLLEKSKGNDYIYVYAIAWQEAFENLLKKFRLVKELLGFKELKFV